MKYTLEDVRTEFTPEFQYGTCDLCMSTAPYKEVVYHLEDENGKAHKVVGSLVDYDFDATPLPDVENVIHFANWLRHASQPNQPLPHGPHHQHPPGGYCGSVHVSG